LGPLALCVSFEILVMEDKRRVRGIKQSHCYTVHTLSNEQMILEYSQGAWEVLEDAKWNSLHKLHNPSPNKENALQIDKEIEPIIHLQNFRPFFSTKFSLPLWNLFPPNIPILPLFEKFGIYFPNFF
jgi:hypothetical protein